MYEYLAGSYPSNSLSIREKMLFLHPITSTSFLGPIIALNGWTFIMEIWLYAKRIPVIQKNTNLMKSASVATRDQWNAKIPPGARWPADNYNHLMEQPTQFYAIALMMTLLERDGNITIGQMDVALAWIYVGLRIVHSFVHCLGNNVLRRFQVFVLSSFTLAAMTVRAAMAVFL